MERIDFQAVFIDFLWLLGATGVLATFSYHDWKRSLFKWGWHAWKLPGFLLPLNLSLTIFCLGLALNGVMADVTAPWWQTTIWAVMTLVFGMQAFRYWRIGN